MIFCSAKSSVHYPYWHNQVSISSAHSLPMLMPLEEDLRPNIIAQGIPEILIRLTNSRNSNVQNSTLRAMSHLVVFSKASPVVKILFTSDISSR